MNFAPIPGHSREYIFARDVEVGMVIEIGGTEKTGWGTTRLMDVTGIEGAGGERPVFLSRRKKQRIHRWGENSVRVLGWWQNGVPELSKGTDHE